MTVKAVTGHRPQHLDDDFATSTPLWRWLAAHLDAHLYGISELRCGMALGVDLLAAERAYLMGVPYYAYIPFVGQAERWPPGQRVRYSRAIIHAKGRTMVNEGGYEPWKMHARNEAMILTPEPVDAVIAVWDGRKSGGTYDAVRVAEKRGIGVERIDPGRFSGG